MGTALLWVIGVGRALTGIVLLAAPERSAERWAGSTSPVAAYFVRGIGGRDLAIGAGLIAALLGGRDTRPWLGASVAGDVADAVAAVALDDEHARKAASIAGGFGVLGVLAGVLTDD